jgi:curved DNA-binding protein CbpA
MATHYQVLGVHSKADTATIRAAYLELIKRHHPDRGPSGASHVQITEINLAYSVLRDSRKRADYDEELLRQWLRSQPPPMRRHPPMRTSVPWQRRNTLALRTATVAVAVLLVAIPSDLFVDKPAAFDAQTHASVLPAEPVKAPEPVPASVPMPAPVLDPSIENIIEVALAVPLDDAQPTSLRCFQEIEGLRATSAADHCIAFDIATSFWQDGDFATAAQRTYFDRAAMRRRHYKVLAAIEPASARDRLQALDRFAISELVDLLKVRETRQREALREAEEAAFISDEGAMPSLLARD